MMLKQAIKGLACASVLLAVGCTQGHYRAANQAQDQRYAQSAITKGMGDSARFADAAQLLAKNGIKDRQTIYFGFDKTSVTDSAISKLMASAKFLATHKDAKVRIEGYTDERGSPEYNIALGERRAQAIENILLSQGARPEQVEIISYGEENPQAMGHDEGAWKQNRRGVIVYNTIG